MSDKNTQENFLQEHIRGLLKRAAELEVDAAQHKLSWEYWEREKQENEAPPEWLIDTQDEVFAPFRFVLHSLYEAVLCYLDLNKFDYFAEHFLNTFGNPFDATSAASKFNNLDDHPSSGIYNIFLADLDRFLSVFKFAKGTLPRKETRPTGILILENILKNTAQIIYEMNAEPKSEPDVYKAVKHVIKAAFPSSKDATSNFCKTSGEYKPDILVPELQVAIEYKYADNEARLKHVIDEIHADTKGYTGDPDYREFYAVFYVTDDFLGEDRFNIVWNEKGFPNNWKAYYKVGRGRKDARKSKTQ